MPAAVHSLADHRARQQRSEQATLARLERVWREAEEACEVARGVLDACEDAARDALGAYRRALTGAVAPVEPRTFASVLADLADEEAGA